MKLISIFLTLGFVLASCSHVSKSETTQTTPETKQEPVVAEATDETPSTNASSFTYLTYSKSATAELEAEGKPYAVFWASKSCGTCAKKDAEIKDRLEELPEGTAILRAEFEEASDTELEEYGVVKYDTFTVFNTDGEFETIRGASIDEVAGKLVVKS